MSYSDLRMFPTDEEKGEILFPTKFSQEPRVTEATSIFKKRAADLICYFCEHGDKSHLSLDNGVLCNNPKSMAPGMIVSAESNCSENSEGVKEEKQLELAL